MKSHITYIAKLLTAIGIIFSLVHLSVVIWETNLVFAEINEENESPVEDETCAEYVITLHGEQGLATSHLFLSGVNDDLAHMDRLSGHFEIDSPPPERVA